MIDRHGAIPFTASRVPHHEPDACSTIINLHDLRRELDADRGLAFALKRVVSKALQYFGFTTTGVTRDNDLEQKFVVVVLIYLLHGCLNHESLAKVKIAC